MPATTRIRAVLMDLDGTLYRQRPLRARMLKELAALPFSGVSVPESVRTVRRLRTFRTVREELRELGQPETSLDELQYAEPARRSDDDPAAVRAVVAEWIHERPIRHLPALRRVGLLEAANAIRGRGVQLGVFSDYPVDAKLESLGLGELFALRLCATDPEINAFKPHPRGFLHACERWGFEPSEVLYVGDRVEVDGAGARAAGMRCAIVSQRAPGEGYQHLPSMAFLEALVVEP